MVERVRWADEEVGHALRTLVGRGKLVTKNYRLDAGWCGGWMSEADLARLVRSAPQAQRSTILYATQETSGADPDFIWLGAALKRKISVAEETAKALRYLRLHHVHRGSGGGEAGTGASSRKTNAEWWKKHLRRAVIGALGLERGELWPLLGSHYDAGQPAPWCGKPAISPAEQMWFRLEVAFSRSLRSDADCAEAVVNYERSGPLLPPRTSLVKQVAKQFGISELEVTELLELGHHLRGDNAAELAHWSTYVPTTHAWGLLARFQEVCLLHRDPPVAEASCEITVALMSCGLHLAENVTFITFLSRHLNLTRESTARYLAGQLAEHKCLNHLIPKLEEGLLPRWVLGKHRRVMPILEDLEPECRAQLATAEIMLFWAGGEGAEAALDKIPGSLRAHPDVLEQGFNLQLALKDWQNAWEIAQHLLRVQPQNVKNWVNASQALRHLPAAGLRQAYDLLLSAAKMRTHCQQAVVGYNLGRYACQLEDFSLAGWWLNRAFALEPGDKLKLAALDEPDLKPLWRGIESQLSEAACAARAC